MWKRLSVGQRIAWGVIAWLWSIPLLMALMVLIGVKFSTNSGAMIVFAIYAMPAFLVEMVTGRSNEALTIAVYLALVAGLTWFVWRKARPAKA